ncbi:helix-turn-helix transcriptional regulator [Bacillus gobiensis]|uniref:helix-turn-helix domain-containing protein n=1 Tax=Bacillus gobiensis TaxID=1441095 RepID=UPI003D1A8411
MERKKIVRFELKQLLQEKGMTQVEFGLKCTPPMNKPQVNKLTKAKMISFDMLERIVNALELNEDEIGRLIRVYKVKE